MSDTVIQVEGLSKRYRIGALERPRTRAGEIRRLAGAPFRWLARSLRAPHEEEILWALKDVSFEVQRGEVVGIIGRNGAGKSTLLKILSRITDPTEGRAVIRGRVGSLLEVGSGFHPELTGRENVYLNGAILGMRRAEIARKFDEIVAFAEVERFIDTPVKHYSSGMYVRLAFAVAAHLETEILLVDEVLAVGDATFQQKCIATAEGIARSGRTVFLVSHNVGQLCGVCARGFLLDKGRIRRIGAIEAVVEEYLSAGTDSKTAFVNSPLKWAEVVQNNGRITITAQYATEEPIALPCLAFVIRDYAGHPVCGSNPLVDGVPPGPPSSEGLLSVTLIEPALIGGRYHVSLGFSDGATGRLTFAAPDCLTLEMPSSGSMELPMAAAGPVRPRCEWKLERCS